MIISIFIIILAHINCRFALCKALAATPDDLCLVPSTHMVEEEN